MKRFGTYTAVLFAVCLSFGSCLKDSLPLPFPGNNEIRFSISIPGEQAVVTRGTPITSGSIDNMYVLVFDENGSLLSRTEAVPGSTVGSYTLPIAPTDPDAPVQNRRRIVHFVCNYDWSQFQDANNLGKHENELIGGLSVGSGISYWQRIELPQGISVATFPSTIELIRNTAKVSVAVSANLLSDASFGIGDYLDRGTVAPFDSSTLTFRENSLYQAHDAVRQAVSESAFTNANGGEIICYEMQNSTSETPMYVILKGRYNNSSAYTYYKIDIINSGEEILHDIIRNHHYQIIVTAITGAGHPSLEQAAASAASNNLLYSVVLKDYPSISDGSSALSVESMSKTYVEAGAEFSIGYSYIPNISTGVEDNTIVTFTLEQDTAKPVVDVSYTPVISRTPGDAWYKAKTAALPLYEVHSARLIISATRGGVILRRVVDIRLRSPFVFENPSVTTAPRAVKQPVEVRFTLPTSLRSELYPMEIFITTRQLSPDPAYTASEQLSLDYAKPGSYRYRYVARAAGEYVIHFLTTASTTSETIWLESELFSPVSLSAAN